MKRCMMEIRDCLWVGVALLETWAGAGCRVGWNRGCVWTGAVVLMQCCCAPSIPETVCNPIVLSMIGEGSRVGDAVGRLQFGRRWVADVRTCRMTFQSCIPSKESAAQDACKCCYAKVPE